MAQVQSLTGIPSSSGFRPPIAATLAGVSTAVNANPDEISVGPPENHGTNLPRPRSESPLREPSAQTVVEHEQRSIATGSGHPPVTEGGFDDAASLTAALPHRPANEAIAPASPPASIHSPATIRSSADMLLSGLPIIGSGLAAGATVATIASAFSPKLKGAIGALGGLFSLATLAYAGRVNYAAVPADASLSRKVVLGASNVALLVGGSGVGAVAVRAGATHAGGVEIASEAMTAIIALVAGGVGYNHVHSRILEERATRRDLELDTLQADDSSFALSETAPPGPNTTPDNGLASGDPGSSQRTV